MRKVKLSIVTVCYNSSKTISNCIESVLRQNNNNYEYIIIDGASDDGTVEIAKTYKEKFEEKDIKYTIISEPDLGIYNAMNKGIDRVSGEWILYLNSDDEFYGNKAIRDFLNSDFDSYDVVYGDVVIKTKDSYIFQKAGELERLKSGTEMPFCHQSTFTKTSILKQFHFDENYKIIADIDLYLRILENNGQFCYIEQYISIFSNEGVSQTNRIKSIREAKVMLKHHAELNIMKEMKLNSFIIWYRLKSVLPVRIQNNIKKLLKGKL